MPKEGAYKNFALEIDKDGIAAALWDMPGRSMNVLSPDAVAELSAIIDRVAADDAIKGAVLTSAKEAFCAGADLGVLGSGGGGGGGAKKDKKARLKETYDGVLAMNMQFRKLESCGKPIAAALNGTALGGGLEVALACHYRIAADDVPSARFGLPEARVGLLPGGGGTQRLPRLIGSAAALPLIMQGTSLTAEKALQAGLIHETAPKAELIARAKRWILEKGDATQPWDKQGFRIPGGKPHERGGGLAFVMGNAQLRKSGFGNYPAQEAIMSAVYEGIMLPMEAALRVEARYFTKILHDPRAQAMVRSLFLSMQDLRKGARRPKDAPPFRVKNLGILGAGLMGSGIAHVSAAAGMEVCLLDRDLKSAQRGKEAVVKSLEKRKARKRVSEDEAAAILSRIHPTDDFAALKKSDLVIEAVFENRDIKAEVTKETEKHIGAGAFFGSNTSTLPITGLAEASARPERFIGVHFFSPVERMQLVELIRGKKTSDETLAAAMDYVRAIGKIPIVVNDSRGFYTSRVFGTYLREGLAMLSDGAPAAMIENAGRMTGMPMPPLALSDEVGIDLAHKVQLQTRADLGEAYRAGAGDAIIASMVEDHARHGRKNGRGFYDYDSDGGRRLWDGLGVYAKGEGSDYDAEILRRRFLYIQSLEAVRCLEEGVVEDLRDADVGAILGWGFAPWSGGPISLIDIVGSDVFAERCRLMADEFGARFSPPDLLEDLGKRGECFYDRFQST